MIIVSKLLKKFSVYDSGVIAHIAAGLHSSDVGNNNVLDAIKILRSFKNLTNY